jgi:raffinose/stachyose/melibiose transport system permease protein
VTTTKPIHAEDLVDFASAGSTGPRPFRSSTRAARTRRKWYEIIGLTVPAAAIYTLFVLVPMGFAVYYSLFRWRGSGAPTDFIGLDNYFGPYGALKDPLFQAALLNNLKIVFGSLLLQGPLAIAIALLLNRRFRGRAVFRMLVFVPYVLAEVTVGVMWRLILTNDGVLDTVMRSIGLGGLVRSWLGDPDLVIWTVLGVLTWKYLGFAIILLLAGLSNVPEELSEAAAIDGANWWQVQWHVTLPLLGPTIRIWAFLSMIGSLQVFDVVWLVTTQAIKSLGAANTMATYMVSEGFLARSWGYGSAVSVILFVISFGAALLFQRLVLQRDIQGALTERS